jgi:hypothetical protein
MKIFSNFDTKLKRNKLKEYQDRYGIDKIILLHKSRLFLIVKIIPRFFSFIIIMILAVVASNWIFWSAQAEYTIYVLVGTFIILLTFAWPVIKHFIDYHMDFALITPEALIMFNQTWIFKRDMSTVDINKIKTISIRKRYFMYSVFNNWDLIFLSEGDSSFWEIVLYFIPKPEEKKERISKLIWYSL